MTSCNACVRNRDVAPLLLQREVVILINAWNDDDPRANHHSKYIPGRDEEITSLSPKPGGSFQIHVTQPRPRCKLGGGFEQHFTKYDVWLQEWMLNETRLHFSYGRLHHRFSAKVYVASTGRFVAHDRFLESLLSPKTRMKR